MSDYDGSQLEREILQCFSPGFGITKNCIQSRLKPWWTRRGVERCMTDMHRRGLIDYAEGQGFWFLRRP